MLVIPVIDHLDEHLASAAVSQKYDHMIRAAVLIGKRTLNQYYDRTDQSELYQIAIGMLYVLSIHAYYALGPILLAHVSNVLIFCLI